MKTKPQRRTRSIAFAAVITAGAAAAWVVWARHGRLQTRVTAAGLPAGQPASTAAPVSTPPREPLPRPGDSASTGRWSALARQPASIARDAELADTLAQLADSDPDTAEKLLRELSDTDRRRVIAAILLDASRDRGLVLHLAGAFCRLDPTGAVEHGYALVGVLARVGEFDAAVQFVRGQAAGRGESENPVKWVESIFAQWAARDGAAAIAAATALPEGGMRDEALDATVRTWVKIDPQALAAWTVRREAGPESDRGAAALAASMTVLQPEVAVRWAERIGAPGLRVQTIASIARQWRLADAAAAWNFLRVTAALRPDERAALEAEWRTMAGEEVGLTNSAMAPAVP